MSVSFSIINDPFASPIGSRPLASDEFNHALSFLHFKDLARAEAVCRSWNRFIKRDPWKKQCQKLLNIPTNDDPKSYFPAKLSYKECFVLVCSKIYDEGAYRHFLGAKTEAAPRISDSLKKWNEPDPCGPASTIGEKYFWMYSPPYFEITVGEDSPLDLDKPDDPNDAEAPRLIRNAVGLGSKSRTLRVPNTINNLGELFKDPKNGNPSMYSEFAWRPIFVQHGNKRIPSGWICMREDVIGTNLSFVQQEEAATEAKVVISGLGHRILFNFLRRAETNAYSDGDIPSWTFALTSTRTIELAGTAVTTGCGGGGHSGLNVLCTESIDNGYGVAVTLPVDAS